MADELRKVPGVVSADVNHERKTAVVSYDPAAADRRQLHEAVARAGYRVPETPVSGGTTIDQPARGVAVQIAPPSSQVANVEPSPRVEAVPNVEGPPAHDRPSSTTPLRTTFTIEGMHCASCVGRVEAAIRSVPGAVDADVNLAWNEGWVSYDPRRAAAAQFEAAVQAAGYTAHAVADNAGADEFSRPLDREVSLWRTRLLVGVSLLAIHVASHFAGHSSEVYRFLNLLTAAGIQTVLGAPFVVGALRQARRFTADMDTLVGLGSSTAFVAGVADWFGHHESMYLMDGALILVFITLGKWLEARARRHTSLAVRKLLELAPPQAVVLFGERTRTMPVGEVEVGMSILVRPERAFRSMRSCSPARAPSIRLG
ncbi:MAG: cation transporter [Pirellulales bacterium]